MASVAEKPSAEELPAQLPAEEAKLQEQVAEAPPPQAPVPGDLQVAKEEPDPHAASANEQLTAAEDDDQALRCATCHREVDLENTVVVNRQTTKRKEVRRCKSCHSVRAAVQRLQKNHGTLVEDFSQVPGNKVEAFYKAHGHLRGEDLRLALQEVVTDWKQSTTELSFTGTGEFLDLESLEKKYEDRPGQLDSIKAKTYKFWDHIRGCYLYEDVKYTRTAQDKVVTGTSRKRKGQVNLLGEDDPPEEAAAAGSAAGSGSKKKPKKGEKGDGEDLPTIKTQQLKKLSAAAESINAKRLTCLDLIDRARNDYVDMIPGYVVTAANTCVSDACKLVRKMEILVHAKKGHVEDLFQEAKDMMAAMQDNLNRIKGQVDQAASFRDQAASS